LPNSLYLDTARLGRLSPSAQQTHLDFVRLAAEEPSSLYFEKFLHGGFSAWPARYQRRFSRLSCWPGIGKLKASLTRIADGHDSSDVLIASRSAQLMMLAARLLSKTCRNVLTTDLSWPAYQNILQHEAHRSGNKVHAVGLRTSVLRESMSADEFVAKVVQAFGDNNCDGLFLPAVDNLGIRVPIGKVVAAIRREYELRFVVVDAAQAFAHVPLDDSLSVADFTIAGCHKWLRGYFPLGLGFCSQLSTREFIDRTASDMLGTAALDDGLLRFCGQVSNAALDGYSETVNLGPLFSCCGAAIDATAAASSTQELLACQSANAKLVQDLALGGNWRPVVPDRAFRTGILLLEQCDRVAEAAEDVRRHLQKVGMIATGYDGGLARLSMPRRPFQGSELQLLRKALAPRRTNAISAAALTAVPKPICNA
jgi:selenocysteine lyase/cysteine desulfurase